MRLHNAMSGCFLLSDARRKLHLWYQPKERKKLWWYGGKRIMRTHNARRRLRLWYRALRKEV